MDADEMENYPTCPLCEFPVPLMELQKHVNCHLDEADNARDHALALEIASSSPQIQTQEDENLEYARNVKEDYVSKKPRTGEYRSTLLNNSIMVNSLAFQQLALSQKICKFQSIDEGVMNLLRDCLYFENQKSSSTVIAAHVDHVESCASEDVGWGCGWRNIQMLSSHLLMYTWARNALFGGVGFVPDIPSLQQWLEYSWSLGFDEPGAEFYHHKIYGSKEWIGTTECATLFRSFGLRARIIDFSGKSNRAGQTLIDRWLHNNNNTPGNNVIERNNLNDKLDRDNQIHHRSNADKKLDFDHQIHHNVQCDVCDVCPIRGIRYKSKKRSNYDLCALCMADRNNNGDLADYEKLYGSSNEKELAKDEDANHESLVKWVWRYFIDGIDGGSSKAQMYQFQGHVATSRCTPLYFQHQGHSRTIVGIQRRKKSESKEDVFLLILDPSTKTKELAHALRSKRLWQKLIKRGIHTLKKQSYQVCYIEPGIAEGEELQQLKTLKSELVLS